MLKPRHHFQIGSATFYQGGPRVLSEWEEAAKEFLDQGQAFLAYDLLKTALEYYPDSLKLKQYAALALVRTGAIEEAKQILEPFYMKFQPDIETLQLMYRLLRKSLTIVAGDSDKDKPSKEALEVLGKLYREMGRSQGVQRQHQAPDEETLGILGRIYKESWKRTKIFEEAKVSRDIYLRAFRETGGYWTGINAATMSRLIGDLRSAELLANEVLEKCKKVNVSDEEKYWIFATIGEAKLLLGKTETSKEAYKKAANVAGDRHAFIVASIQQLRLLENNGFRVPRELFDILKPPTVVIFCGHKYTWINFRTFQTGLKLI